MRGQGGAETLAEAWQLGLGAAVPMSAAHGDGLIDLFDALLERGREIGLEEALFAAADKADENIDDISVPEEEDGPDIWIDERDKGPVRMAIIGRPNMGKSTLANTLLGEARLLTGPEAGITRDSITLPFEWEGQAYELVDTAGMRRRHG